MDTNVQAETLAEGQETVESTPKEFVTLADEPGDTEAEVEVEAGEETTDEAKPEGEKPEAPKKPSGSARLKERLRAAEEELAQIRQTQPAKPKDGKSDLVEPKESDFPNDYLAFDRAQRAYEIKKSLREENQRVADERAQDNEARAHRARQNAYHARLDDVKDRIPDYDTTMKAQATAPVRDDIRDLILDDGKGPLIAYHLAKNPDKLEALNRMTPIEAAREIGRLSVRIRGPQAKTVTTAKPPLSIVKGGAARVSAAEDPSNMSMEKYNKWRDEQEK